MGKLKLGGNERFSTRTKVIGMIFWVWSLGIVIWLILGRTNQVPVPDPFTMLRGWGLGYTITLIACILSALYDQIGGRQKQE